MEHKRQINPVTLDTAVTDAKSQTRQCRRDKLKCEFDKLAKRLAKLIGVSNLTVAQPNAVGQIDRVFINCSLRPDTSIIYMNVRQANLANDCQSLTVTTSW